MRRQYVKLCDLLDFDDAVLRSRIREIVPNHEPRAEVRRKFWEYATLTLFLEDEGAFHDLITPHEQANTAFNIRVGDHVLFELEGMQRAGRVNRITRRATVLVEDPGGRLYADGKRYRTYYVPLPLLRKEGRTG